MATGSNGQSSRVTLSEIARAAKVAKSTVSMVLNGSPSNIPISDTTRNRVIQVARKLCYRPNSAARALAMGRTETILMVLFDQFDPPFFERLLGVESYLTPRGYTVSICTLTDEPSLAAFSRVLHSGKADGVLLATTPTKALSPLLRKMREEVDQVGIPVVAVENTVPPWLRDCYTTSDDAGGATLAVNHLIEHGHRRIAMISEQPHDLAEQHTRETAYRTALQAAGIEVDEALVVRCSPDDRAKEFDAITQLAKHQEFTALFAVTDATAMVALSALKAVGRRIPEDCAVVGFDNRRDVAMYLDPPLTTVTYPFYESGCASCDLLLKMIDGEPVEPVVLPVSLVIRRSCGCNPDSVPGYSPVETTAWAMPAAVSQQQNTSKL